MEKVKISVKQIGEIKLPSNLEAEQALIGSVMVNNDIIDEISNIVNSNKFFDPAHKKIYEVIETLNNKGMIANPITLKNYFEKDENLKEVGGVEYLVKLTRFSSSSRQPPIANSNPVAAMKIHRCIADPSDAPTRHGGRHLVFV